MNTNSDNASPLDSATYDRQITSSLPYYGEFAIQIRDILDLHRTVKAETGTEPEDAAMEWLDLGCGTGILEEKMLAVYPDTHFTLLDPAENMLAQAKARFRNKDFEYICAPSQGLPLMENRFDVATAVQSHMYLHMEERPGTLKRIYDDLKPGGIFINIETFVDEDPAVREFELRRWGEYRIRHGFERADLENWMSRCGVNYYPITIPEYITLMKEAGFLSIHVFWLSYMQFGIYGIK